MELSKMTTKWQITIPKSVRKKLGIDVGDNVVFIQNGNGFMIFNERTVEKAQMGHY